MARAKLFPPKPSSDIEPDDGKHPHAAFEEFARRVLSVPPDEIKRREQEWGGKAAERKHREHRMPGKVTKRQGGP